MGNNYPWIWLFPPPAFLRPFALSSWNGIATSPLVNHNFLSSILRAVKKKRKLAMNSYSLKNVAEGYEILLRVYDTFIQDHKASYIRSNMHDQTIINFLDSYVNFWCIFFLVFLLKSSMSRKKLLLPLEIRRCFGMFAENWHSDPEFGKPNHASHYKNWRNIQSDMSWRVQSK